MPKAKLETVRTTASNLMTEIIFTLSVIILTIMKYLFFERYFVQLLLIA